MPAPDRRLRALARGALAQYDGTSEDGCMTTVAQSFNTVFRVRDQAGRDAALRVGPAERIHIDGTEFVEARWMRALRADGAVQPPEVIDAADGTPVVRQGHAGVAGERICMLFGWVPGRPLSGAMTGARATEMGQLAARLHEHASNALLPGASSVLVADRVLYWRVDNRLGSAQSGGSLFEEALERAERVLAAIWADPPHPPHLLHGDLTADNVMLSAGTLVPIDFQDLVWGLEIQDLAISLASFGRFDGAEELREQFRRGYEMVRPWPDLDPETTAALTAARRLHQLNLGLNLRRPGLDALVVRARQLIGEWMS